MNDVDAGSLALQDGQAANHRLIDGMRALAASKYEHRRSATVLGCNFKKCLAHRNAGNFGVAKIFCGFLEMHGCARNKFGDHAIGESRHHVGLEGERRNMLHDSRQHCRAGGVSTHADHHVRREFIQHPSRIPDGAGKVEGRFQASREADILQRAHADELQRKSRGGNQAVLDAARGSDEQNFGVVTVFSVDWQWPARGSHVRRCRRPPELRACSDYKLTASFQTATDLDEISD